MKREAIISVLIVTYNQEQYIGQAIESALMQQLDEPFEVVIGEDGSTDETRAICQRYVDNYPEIVRLMPECPNKGLLNNYYDTLLACRGEFIADCAGDDYWCDPLKLQRQLTIMRENPEVSMTHTNVQRLNNSTGKLEGTLYESTKKRRLNWFTGRKEVLNQLGTPVVFTGSSLFRRVAFSEFYLANESLFRDSRYTCEDLQLVFALLHQGDLHYEDRVTTCYRISEESVSQTLQLPKQQRFGHGVLQLRLDLLRLFELSALEAADSIAYRLKEALSLGLKLGDCSPALALYDEAMVLSFQANFSLRCYAKAARYNYLVKLISSLYPKI